MNSLLEHFFQQREQDELGVDDQDLAEYAELLGGEVDGKFILCPSPGLPLDDRSCCVRIDGLKKIYIYYCEGPLGKAYAFVRGRLKLAPNTSSPDNSAYALRILGETVSATGTLVETYLRSRALTLPIPPCLRFHGSLKHKPSGGSHWPAMIAERSSVAGHIVAIHRTFVAHDGRGKAPVSPHPPRMDLGPATGTSIRLSPVADDLMIGEGIETVLSAMQATGRPGWAAGSAMMMRLLALPDEVGSVLILADGDDAGEAAARDAKQRWLREGRRVRIARAPRGKDFNDILMERSQAQKAAK